MNRETTPPSQTLLFFHNYSLQKLRVIDMILTCLPWLWNNYTLLSAPVNPCPALVPPPLSPLSGSGPPYPVGTTLGKRCPPPILLSGPPRVPLRAEQPSLIWPALCDRLTGPEQTNKMNTNTPLCSLPNERHLRMGGGGGKCSLRSDDKGRGGIRNSGPWYHIDKNTPLPLLE